MEKVVKPNQGWIVPINKEVNEKCVDETLQNSDTRKNHTGFRQDEGDVDEGIERGVIQVRGRDKFAHEDKEDIQKSMMNSKNQTNTRMWKMTTYNDWLSEL